MLEPLIINVAIRSLSDDFLCADIQATSKPTQADGLLLAAHPKRRQEQQISRSLRRQLLSDYLLVESDQLEFAQHVHGKPYLKNHTQIEFSQSHCSDQLILVMNNQGVAVGVDIEAKDRLIKVHALAARILTPKEFEQFKQAIDQQAFLLRVWTIKEAVLKATGLGIRLNLNELESHENFNNNLWGKVGRLQHAKIGSWAYQSFDSITHYYTVAWQHTNQYADDCLNDFLNNCLNDFPSNRLNDHLTNNQNKFEQVVFKLI